MGIGNRGRYCSTDAVSLPFDAAMRRCPPGSRTASPPSIGSSTLVRVVFGGPKRMISTGPTNSDDPRARTRPSVSVVMSRKKASRSSRPVMARVEATESSNVTRPPTHLMSRYVERSMPKLELSDSVVVHTTPERAFDYFADHRHVADVLQGVTRWEPISKRTTGVGARYNVELVAMGFPL